MEATRPRKEILAEIIAGDPRYPLAAYEFVSRALQVSMLELQEKNGGERQHVTGRQLVENMRSLLLGQYGCMAIDVLDAWNIHETADFGNLVFNMVEGKLLGVSKDDSRADFDGLFDFYEVFVIPYVSRRKTPRPMPVLAGRRAEG